MTKIFEIFFAFSDQSYLIQLIIIGKNAFRTNLAEIDEKLANIPQHFLHFFTSPIWFNFFSFEKILWYENKTFLNQFSRIW